MQKKSESQTKDMKKMMKDNAQSLTEFEKALARKSGECNVCCVVIISCVNLNHDFCDRNCILRFKNSRTKLPDSKITKNYLLVPRHHQLRKLLAS